MAWSWILDVLSMASCLIAGSLWWNLRPTCPCRTAPLPLPLPVAWPKQPENCCRQMFISYRLSRTRHLFHMLINLRCLNFCQESYWVLSTHARHQASWPVIAMHRENSNLATVYQGLKVWTFHSSCWFLSVPWSGSEVPRKSLSSRRDMYIPSFLICFSSARSNEPWRHGLSWVAEYVP